MIDYKKHIWDVPDWPKQGILFRDLSPLYLDNSVFSQLVTDMTLILEPMLSQYSGQQKYLVAAEARGFILGSVLARSLNLGFVPARKPGKLPREHVTAEYELEYGVDTLALHKDVFAAGAPVVVFDDLLAKGGTAKACCDSVKQAGGVVVGCSFIVELTDLEGREKLEKQVGDVPIRSLIQY